MADRPLHDQGDPTPDVFVRISNREIYDAIQSLERTTQHMDDRMNSILGENVKIEKRVRALELKVYAVLSAFSGIIIVGGMALAKGLFGG